MPSNLAQLRHAFFHLSEGRVNAGKDVLASVIRDMETEGCEDDKFTHQDADEVSQNLWMTLAERWAEIAISCDDPGKAEEAANFASHAYHVIAGEEYA